MEKIPILLFRLRANIGSPRHNITNCHDCITTMSGFASNDDSSSPSNKRTRFFNDEAAPVPQVAGTAKKQLVTKSPTEAAMALKNSHIATLHEALQPFLQDLTETCPAASDIHAKIAKNSNSLKSQPAAAIIGQQPLPTFIIHWRVGDPLLLIVASAPHQRLILTSPSHLFWSFFRLQPCRILRGNA